ncbi:unnamed protein product [Adineta ricciae]|uniref:Nuclear receptor domain-containing protein n=1 Tax=Adineta ricciae TaxID=249248 RepID=A0A815UMG8_ADIRI|nr:unnamed protein product [Adineta ricciae]
MNNDTEMQLCNQICGDTNAQVHYGSLCCSSCAAFFRRNSRVNFKGRKCVFGTKCDITTTTRQICRFCRLERCFAIGMQEKIKHISRSQTSLMKIEGRSINEQNNSIDALDWNTSNPSSLYIHLPFLLVNDRSSLSTDEWSTLSNVINIFDSRSPIPVIRNVVDAISNYPVKIRIKSAAANIKQVMELMYGAVVPLVDNILDFRQMSSHDQSALLERNVPNTSILIGTLIFRDAGVYSSPLFNIDFPSLYGPIVAERATKTKQLIDTDGTLLKLIGIVLMFSTNTTIITEHNISNNDSMQKFRSFSNSNYLLHIQNIYVDILFKYMIYRYGYMEAVLRFAALIRVFIFASTTQYYASQELATHDELMDSLIKNTEQLVITQN